MLLPLAGCTGANAAISWEGHPLAPAVPRDERSHGTFEALTGINGDAVAAITGDATRSYIYFDSAAANKAALEAAPAHLCASYGQSLESSYLTRPADRQAGLMVLAVDCSQSSAPRPSLAPQPPQG